MTNEAEIAAILEFIADAEETLPDPVVLANYAALGAPTETAISQAKAQIATLRVDRDRLRRSIRYNPEGHSATQLAKLRSE